MSKSMIYLLGFITGVVVYGAARAICIVLFAPKKK